MMITCLYPVKNPAKPRHLKAAVRVKQPRQKKVALPHVCPREGSFQSKHIRVVVPGGLDTAGLALQTLDRLDVHRVSG